METEERNASKVDRAPPIGSVHNFNDIVIYIVKMREKR